MYIQNGALTYSIYKNFIGVFQTSIKYWNIKREKNKNQSSSNLLWNVIFLNTTEGSHTYIYIYLFFFYNQVRQEERRFSPRKSRGQMCILR